MVNLIEGEPNRNNGNLRGIVESDLEACIEDPFQVVWLQAEVAPGLQEPEGDVFCRTHALGKGVFKQTALLDQLKNQASDLQKIVADLACCVILTIGVFQFESPILLDVEAFVFNLPSQPPALIG